MPVKRFLDPLERTMEVLFGVIMVVVFTASIELTGSANDVHDVLVAAVGCNVAWGLVDAAMYLMARFAERARGVMMLNAVRGASEPQLAHGVIADGLPPGLARMLGPAEYEAIRQRLRAQETVPRAALDRDDYGAALGVFLIVFVSTLPVVAPFVLMAEVRPAMRLSQFVAVGMLFIAGWQLGLHAGRPAWRMGLAMVTIGAALSAITFLLGG
jgi:hypothetical protein